MNILSSTKRPEILGKLPGNFISVKQREHGMPKILLCIPTLSRLLYHFASIPGVPITHPFSHHLLFLCCPSLSGHGLHTRLCLESSVGHLDGLFIHAGTYKDGLLTLPGTPVKLQPVAISCTISLATRLCRIALFWLFLCLAIPASCKASRWCSGELP